MTFQLGDVRASINGRSYVLRLTLGALAEIAERLSANSPQTLSQALRALTEAQARCLLSCLSCPPLEAADISALGDDEVAALLPDICRVFERAFEAPKESYYARHALAV